MAPSTKEDPQYREFRFNKVISNSVVKYLGFITNWLVLLPLFSGISEVWFKINMISFLA